MKKAIKNKLEKRLEKDWKNILFNFLFLVLNFVIPFIFINQTDLGLIFLVLISVFGLLKWRSKKIFEKFALGCLVGLIVSLLLSYNFSNFMIKSLNFVNIGVIIIIWGNVFAFIYQMNIELKRLFAR